MRVLLVIALCCNVLLLQAQTILKPIKVNSNIEKVVVYLNGGEIHRSGSVKLDRGRNQLEINGLSPHINKATIQASLGDKVKILSIASDQEILSNQERDEVTKRIKDSITILQDEVNLLKATSENYKQEETLLEKNYSRIGVGESVSMLELQKTAAYYRERLKDITKNLHALTLETRGVNEEIAQLNKRLKGLYRNQRNRSFKVLLTVRSALAQTVGLDLNYVVNNVGWVPKYNIRGEGIDKGIQFEYLAEVFNRSGQEWKDVDLILSTGNPFKSMNKPVLNPWTLNYSGPSYLTRSSSNQDKYKSEGYLDKKRAALNYEDAEVAELDVNIPTEVEVSEVTVDFKIPLPYTIPTDGKPYLVEVAEYQLPASYKYYAVPKLEQDAFLIANVTKWEQVNIIDSKANIYYKGKYVGETYIDTRYANDTLEISLGRDSKIGISRIKRRFQ